jgi:RimJ/RimL family protein N-acetyltransferase
VILETPRLWLREYETADWTAVLEYQSDPRYLRYYPWTERSQADVRAFIQMFIDQQGERPRTKYQLAVILKTTGTLIGSCGIRVDDPERRVANIGYELDPQQWGRGYATEAARAILFFGFETLGLERIWAETIAENQGSIRVLEKNLGCV